MQGIGFPVAGASATGAQIFDGVWMDSSACFLWRRVETQKAPAGDLPGRGCLIEVCHFARKGDRQTSKSKGRIKE